MKKYFMIFAAALLSFAACQEEMAPEINTNEDGIKDYPIKMTFVASNEAGSKTVINGETITWESDDEIKVLWSNTGSNKAIAAPYNENSCAQFTTTVEEADAYYAVHPYAAASSYVDGNIVVKVPALQGGAFENANIAVAKANEANAFLFRHLVGMIEFTTDTPGKVTVSGAEGDVLTGTVTVTGFDENGYPVYSEDKVTDASSVIEIDVKASGTYYAAFLPSATLKCLSVKVEGSEATEYALSANQLKMARGKVIELGNIDTKFGKNLFVSASADGKGDGKTWETALTYGQVAEMLSVYREGALSAEIPSDNEEYKTKHKTVHAAELNNMVFHFAAGEYQSANYVRISFPDNAEGVKFAFRGGYDANSNGTDLSKRNTAEHITKIKGAEGLAGGSATRRVFLINKNIKMTVDGITFIDGVINDVTQVGGGVILADDSMSSTMKFIDCKFTDNTSTMPGAAIKITQGELNLENCQFSNNTISEEKEGAAIHATGANTTVRIKGGKFENNQSAGHGGAVFTTCAEFKATGVTFDTNSAGAKTGGAICCRDTETAAQLILENCTFASNTSSAGGAFYANKGTWTLIGCNFNNNSSTGVGGASYLAGDAEVSLTGGEFKSNIAATNAGVAHVACKSFSAVNVDFIGNKGELTKADNSQGGAIYFANNTSGNERTITDCLFKENSVDAANAGTDNYVRGGAVYIQASSPNVVFTNCTFESNKQLNAAESYKKHGGGAIFATKSFKATGCTFKANDAYQFGAIGIEGGSASINGTFTSNTATTGGAVGTVSGTPTYTSCVFTSNSAANGGAVTATGGTTVFSKCEFSKNASSNFGGVAYVVKNTATLSFTDCDIDSNTSVNNGGAFHFSPIQKATFTDCDITKNAVTGANMGGAFYLSGGSAVDIIRGTINDNSTGKIGGAFYSSNKETVLIDGTTISGNKAKNGEGGAIRFVGAGNWTIRNATVSNNTATSNGGAIYANGGALNITGSTFSGNSSNGTVGGGAIYVTTNAVLAVDDTKFISNNAPSKNGGAINIADSAKGLHKINNTHFSGNESIEGGAMFVASGCTLYMNGCSFSGNVPSKGDTGGVLKTNATTFMNNCSFSDNITPGAYQADLIICGAATVLNSTIIEKSSESASHHTNGIRVYGASSSAMIYNNVILSRNRNLAAGYGGNVGEVTSQGYNYTGLWSTQVDNGVNGLAKTVETDKVVTPAEVFDSFTQSTGADGRNWYTWTKPADVTGTTAANVTTFLNGITGGSDFAAWLGTVDGLTKDIAGNSRPATGWYPGCYQGN